MRLAFLNSATNSKASRRCLLGLVMAIVLSPHVHCAAFDRKNTRLVNLVEEHMVPESTGGKVALAPLIIPIGVSAGILDIFIVHPAYMLPDAAQDTYSFLWEGYSERLNEHYFSYAGWAPIGAMLTPVVFSGLWLAYSSLDVHDDDEDIEKPDGAGITLDVALSGGDVQEVTAWLNRNQQSSGDRSQVIRNSFERFGSNMAFRNSAVYYLGEPKRLGSNETFLANLYMKSREPAALYVLAAARSEKLSRMIIDRIFSTDVGSTETKQLIDALYQINNQEMIALFLTRMRSQ